MFEDCTPIEEEELLLDDVTSPTLHNQYFVEDHNNNEPVVELYDASHLDW